MKKQTILFLLLLSIYPCALGQGKTGGNNTQSKPPSDASKLLPEPILALLKQKYPGSPRENFPGWKLAEVDDTSLQGWKTIQPNAAHPAVVQGDFDSNGANDYAVLIWYGQTFHNNDKKPPTPNAVVVAFLGQADGYKLLELNGAGMNWPEFVDRTSFGYRFLTVAKKGTRRFDWESGKPLTYSHDTLEAWVTQNGGSAFRDLAGEAYYTSVTVRPTPPIKR